MPAAPQPAGRGGRRQSPAPWGQAQRQDEALSGARTEALLSPAVGRGTETHRKVTTQEPQGQTRTRELVGLPSSSSAASPAAPLPLLSTCSWPRARQSCGRGALPRLQRGAAGSDVEVAEAGGSPPAPACHGHGHGCIQQQGAGVPGAAPWLSLPWGQGQGQGLGGKAGGLCESYLGLAMTKASLKRRRSLFLVARPWVTRTRSWSRGSGDGGTGAHCCSGSGSSLQSRGHRA